MITSTANTRIKYIRKLQQRKERQKSGLCYVEGLKSIGEACQQDADIHSLIVAPEILTSPFANQIIQQQTAKGVEIIELSEKVFCSIALKDHPKGLAAIVKQSWSSLAEVRAEQGDIWVALVAIQDPGNLGTILRTLDAVGGKGILLLEQCTDPYDATCIRASTGAVFSKTLIRADHQSFLEWVSTDDVPVVGATGDATNDYCQARYPQEKLVLIMGSEREGLPSEYKMICDDLVSIPMAGRSDSLNLSIATALVLYEVFNQRRLNKI